MNVTKPGARTVVIGQGYVGLPLALSATAAGLQVTGLERDPSVVEALNAGRSHVDDVSDGALAVAHDRGYRATSDEAVLAQADVIVICVPTPLSDEGGPDLSLVLDCADEIRRQLTPETLVILESTTYPGTTEELFAPRAVPDQLTIGRDVFIAYSPERVDPGNRRYDIVTTPKVVGGITEACTRRASDFYGSFVEQVVEAAGTKEAELSKLLENTFRHVNIALVNEMLRFSNDLNIDLWDAIDCAATKPFGFMAFRPGPGVGGHCIPIDPMYLSHRIKARLGYSFRMVELAQEINLAAPLYVADRITSLLNTHTRSVRDSKILLVGVTYKANIADRRQSPADPLAARLSQLGAVLSYHDPLVPRWVPPGQSREIFSGDLAESCKEADLTVVLQHHESVDLSPVLRDPEGLVLDTRGQLRREGHPHVFHL